MFTVREQNPLTQQPLVTCLSPLAFSQALIPVPPRACPPEAPKRFYDFSNEKVYYEGGPHGGDLAVNLALGATLAWLPLTAAAVGRAAFVKYRFTDLRFTVTTTAPWNSESANAGKRMPWSFNVMQQCASPLPRPRHGTVSGCVGRRRSSADAMVV